MAATHSPLALAALLAALLAHAALANEHATQFRGRIGKYSDTEQFVLKPHQRTATKTWSDTLDLDLVGVNVTITEHNGFVIDSPSIEITNDLKLVTLTRHGVLTGVANVEITWQMDPAAGAAREAGARTFEERVPAAGAAPLPAILYD